MSGFNYSDVFEDDPEQQETGTGLRKLLEDALAQNKKLSDRLDSLERQGPVTALLKEKGIDPAVANFVPKDVDPSAWLTENGHLFASTLTKDTVPDPTPEVDDTPPDPDLEAEQAAWLAMQQGSTSTGTTTTQQDPFQQLAALNSEAEMLAFIEQQKGKQGSTGLM